MLMVNDRANHPSPREVSPAPRRATGLGSGAALVAALCLGSGCQGMVPEAEGAEALDGREGDWSTQSAELEEDCFDHEEEGEESATFGSTQSALTAGEVRVAGSGLGLTPAVIASVAPAVAPAGAPASAPPSAPPEAPARDVFGLQMLYPSAPGTRGWDSLHWEQGGARTLSGADPRDPTGWSAKRGNGTLRVDGQGVLTMGGSQPRLYLDGLRAGQRWTNVEVTVYHRRGSNDGSAWGGAIVGTRSGPNGHTTAGHCTASTYYVRLRNDGRADFAKELSHPTAAARGGRAVWSGGALPTNRWIGVKVVVKNQADGSVKLEHYRDLTEGAGGGTWEKINETVDRGGWVAANRCGFAQDRVVTDGGGVVFIRNTGVSRADYKWMSVREIAE